MLTCVVMEIEQGGLKDLLGLESVNIYKIESVPNSQ